MNQRDRTDLCDRLTLADARLFEGLLAQTKVGIAQFHTATGRIIRANQRYFEITGSMPNEMANPRLQSLDPQSASADPEHMRRMLAGEVRELSVEKRHIRKDGAVVWIHQTIGPLWPAGGSPDYHMVLVEDITEQKRVVESLRESEVRYRSIVQQSSDVIALLDTEGQISYISPQAEKIMGYRPADLVKHNPLDFVHPDDLASVSHALGTVMLRTNPGIPTEFRFRHSQGHWIHLEALAMNLLDDPGIRGVLVTCHDVSARKRAEQDREKLREQLLQAQKMESIGRLAGGVAHDFNNMLQAILGNAALALENIPADHPAHECLEEIQKSAQRSAELTRQLLAFARKQTISPVVLDLNETVAGMLRMLRRLIGEDIELAWIPGPNLWPVVMDPSQVSQILANLSVNARDAIAGTGKVTIETANVALETSHIQRHPECTPGDFVMLTVNDTGHGIDAETRAHLFEPFFTTKPVGKGTGLGLATVFGIVTQNRGLIEVWSEPGQGTEFNIYLPRAEACSFAAEPTPPQPVLGGSETLLLVEDEEQILNLGQRILRQQGYQVLAASTPAKALALAEHHEGPIHLLITDVVMPEMNGKVLFNQLRFRYPLVKSLFMSGYTADAIAHHGVLEEGVQFLPKPFSIQTLVAKVREVLDTRP